jgi:DNA repair exonuclease SbcCD nuclease subunit
LSITFLHTADWQLGKPFGSIEGDPAAILREERFEAVKRIAALARDRQVDAVLVAGDVFDGTTAADQVLRRALDAMSASEGHWVLLPGNHDPALPESPWTRLQAIGIPENIVLALACEPIVLADDRLAVLPAPLTRKSEPDDVTQCMNEVETQSDVVRVGLAHGSISNRLPEGDARNEIAEDRAITAKLDYLALGDWHPDPRIDRITAFDRYSDRG